MAKKVLIITYYWPPSGGAGVQRWLKFVKYLPQFGWEPIIYTPENPEYPILDHSLEKDIPEGIEYVKTKIWEPYEIYKKFVGLKNDDKINPSFLSEKKKPKFTENLAVWIRGNLFIPDARKFWIKPSVKHLCKYLKHNPVDAIVSTGPPHSMHLIALQLKKKLNIPWLADFRDPWTQIDFYQELKLSAWADKLNKKLEKRVFESADKIVVVSNGIRDGFNTIFSRKYIVIPNGYDSDDVPKQEIDIDKKFSIAHIGTLVKSRNPETLWKVLKDLVEKYESFNDKLEIKLVGKVDFHVSESIKSYGLEKYLKRIPYLSHNKVMEEQQRSALLLLLINNTPNAKMILTGKLFEYMSARRPVLCIGPEDGDAARIIEETKSGLVSGFYDEAKLKDQILVLFERYRNNETYEGGINIEKYSRRELTNELSKVLNSVCTKTPNNKK